MNGRHSSRSPKLAVAAGTTAVVLAVGGGVAFAATGQSGAVAPTAAATARAHPTASAAAPSRHHHGGRLELRRLAGRALHGTVVLPARSGDRTIDFQRGTLSAITPASAGTGEVVTVVSVDRFTHRYTLSAKTRVRASGHRVAAAQLQVGARVVVVASPVAGIGDALLIRLVRTAPAA